MLSTLVNTATAADVSSLTQNLSQLQINGSTTSVAVGKTPIGYLGRKIIHPLLVKLGLAANEDLDLHDAIDSQHPNSVLAILKEDYADSELSSDQQTRLQAAFKHALKQSPINIEIIARLNSYQPTLENFFDRDLLKKLGNESYVALIKRALQLANLSVKQRMVEEAKCRHFALFTEIQVQDTPEYNPDLLRRMIEVTSGFYLEEVGLIRGHFLWQNKEVADIIASTLIPFDRGVGFFASRPKGSHIAKCAEELIRFIYQDKVEEIYLSALLSNAIGFNEDNPHQPIDMIALIQRTGLPQTSKELFIVLRESASDKMIKHDQGQLGLFILERIATHPCVSFDNFQQNEIRELAKKLKAQPERFVFDAMGCLTSETSRAQPLLLGFAAQSQDISNEGQAPRTAAASPRTEKTKLKG